MARSSSNFAPRLRRMLLMVPWLLESGGSTVAELAARFGVSEDDVIRDLNLVMCCGIPPYGAEATLGSGAETAPSVDVDLESPPLLGVVQAAAAGRERLAVAHWSAWRDEVTERTIDPLLVFSADGHWYVSALDSRSGEVRHFRIDRFAEATPTGERFTPPSGAPTAPPAHVFSGADAVEVTMVLPASARWVAEAYDPIEVADLDDGTGRFRLRLAVAGERWLERLLLRVGPEAVVEAPADLAGVGAAAARRLLARYSNPRSRSAPSGG